MIYGYEQPIQLPTLDLYDKQIMAMALNAAKDMYDRGYQEMKDFRKEYGDFLTPIMADQDWYDQNVTGKVRNAINALYAQGVDPLRNAQGRAMISQIINSIPYGDIAKKKMRAKNAEEYYKNMAILQREGKYDRAFSEYLKEDPNLWAPNSMGVTSPTVYQTMDDIIEPIVKNLKPSYDDELTKAKNDGFDYKTVSKDRILATIDDKMEDLINTSIGGYYYKKAYDTVGGDEKAAKELLKQWYANRASDHVQTDREANPYRLDAAKTANDMKQYKQKAAIDYNYDELALKDLNGDRKIDDNENKLYEEYIKENGYRGSRGGDEKKSEYYNVFESARKDSGVDKSYTVGAEVENYIAPKNNSIRLVQDNKSKQWVYIIPGSQVGNVLYTDYTTSHAGTTFRYVGHGGEDFDKSVDYVFIPNGGLRHKKIDGQDRYFIGGTLREKKKGGSTDMAYKGHGTITYEMEVIENDHTYAKKKAK